MSSTTARCRTRASKRCAGAASRSGCGYARQLKALLYDLIRGRQHRRRNREAEHPGGLEVDHELELGRLRHRQIAGTGAGEDARHVGTDLAVTVVEIGAVAD